VSFVEFYLDDAVCFHVHWRRSFDWCKPAHGASREERKLNLFTADSFMVWMKVLIEIEKSIIFCLVSIGILFGNMSVPTRSACFILLNERRNWN
jgi:hypothetical protein